MINVRNIDTFGHVAAEDDSILEYFIATDTVTEIKAGGKFLILGDKGAGKTALFRYFTEREHQGVVSGPIRMTDYPWGIHAQRSDLGAAEANAYTAAWEYLLAVEYAKVVVRACQHEECDELTRIRKFLRENYGTEDGSANYILTPETIKIGGSLEPKIFGISLFKIDFRRDNKDLRLGAELHALSEALFSNAHAAAARYLRDRRVLLHIDELDHGLAALDEKRQQMLVGLVMAARGVARRFSAASPSFSPVVYLRTDLWDALKFSDKNKIRQTQAHVLQWSEDSLLRLIEARASKKIGHDIRFENLEDGQTMRGSQRKWSHIAARTKLRPRDVIQFMNCVLAVVKARMWTPDTITNKDVGASRTSYSRYFKGELDDEILPHWPDWEVSMGAISSDAKLSFDMDTFVTQYEARARSGSIKAIEALEKLFRFSVIGYRQPRASGGTSWVFTHLDPAAQWDPGATLFKVHLGLKEYYKLREERLPSISGMGWEAMDDLLSATGGDVPDEGEGNDPL